jgi:predicted DNA-binding transcriptional regulator AlpA
MGAATEKKLTGMVDAETFACALGVSKRTLRRLELRGLIPKPIRIGRGIVRWRADDVKSVLNGRETR